MLPDWLKVCVSYIFIKKGVGITYSKSGVLRDLPVTVQRLYLHDFLDLGMGLRWRSCARSCEL